MTLNELARSLAKRYGETITVEIITTEMRGCGLDETMTNRERILDMIDNMVDEAWRDFDEKHDYAAQGVTLTEVAKRAYENGQRDERALTELGF